MSWRVLRRSMLEGFGCLRRELRVCASPCAYMQVLPVCAAIYTHICTCPRPPAPSLTLVAVLDVAPTSSTPTRPPKPRFTPNLSNTSSSIPHPPVLYLHDLILSPCTIPSPCTHSLGLDSSPAGPCQAFARPHPYARPCPRLSFGRPHFRLPSCTIVLRHDPTHDT